MSNNGELPESIRIHIDDLKNKIGNDAGGDLEKALSELMKNLRTTTTANPIESSALFLARPSGYVAVASS